MFMATEQNFWSDWSKQAAKVCEKLDKSYWQHLIDQSRKTIGCRFGHDTSGQPSVMHDKALAAGPWLASCVLR